MERFSKLLCQTSNLLTNALNFLTPLFALAIRLYLARVFLWSGWLKVSDWPGTMNLFKYEYVVPLVPPEVAAYLGTGAELIFGLMVLLGLGARLPALGLFITNFIMVISYPLLMSPEGVCMAKDHYLWALALLILVFYGHGKLSLDYLLQRRVCNEYHY